MNTSPGLLRVAAVVFSVALLIVYVAWRTTLSPAASTAPRTVDPPAEEEPHIPMTMPGSKSAAIIPHADESAATPEPPVPPNQPSVLPGSKSFRVDIDPFQPPPQKAAP